MKIVLAGDHSGFALKKIIVEFLKKYDHQVIDVGPAEKVSDDDYPDYVKKAIPKILENSDNRGIFLCRNGVGVCIAGNKYKGIRAALSWNPKHAVSSRNDDDTNVLCLPVDYIDERKALEIVSAWLLSSFSNEPRHHRRVQKVGDILK